jgi:FkbM family methyltransferase
MRLTDTDRQQLRHLQKLGIALRHFYDVGASNGRWSSRVSQDFPEATFELFEPLVEVAPEYQRNMASTLAAHPRFRLHKIALGSQCKSTVMYWYPENTVGSTALELERVPPTAKAVKVTMLTLDYAVQEFRLPVPQVIKMDTQGCELGILTGARETLPQVTVLLLECWLSRAYGKPTPLLLEVAEWLREIDFHLWDFGNGWRNEEGTLVAQDCLFLNARSKISHLQDEPRRSVRIEPEVVGLTSERSAWLKRMRNILWHH